MTMIADDILEEMKSIISRTALLHNIPYNTILGRTKFKDVIIARDEAIQACREELDLSTVVIGKVFNKSPEAIMYTLKKSSKYKRKLRKIKKAKAFKKSEKLKLIEDLIKNKEKDEEIKEVNSKSPFKVNKKEEPEEKRKWDCVNYDECLNNAVFNNEPINCIKCDYYERKYRSIGE